jgi:predicted N-acetyltransferase YhbS
MQSGHANKARQSMAIGSMVPDQVEAAGKLVYEAFRDVATRHGFQPSYDTPQFATFVVRLLSQAEGFASFVAIEDGQPLAVNFLDQRNDVAGVGPVAVGVEHQGRGLGRMVMEALLERAEGCGFQSVRLLQSAYNLVSFSLYCRLGFAAKDEIADLRGRPHADEDIAATVRECTPGDLDDLDRLSLEVLGFRRRGDVETVMPFVPPLLAEREGRLVGYVCRFPTPSGVFLGPAAARDQEALKNLIVGAARLVPGSLRLALPLSCSSLLRWALQSGFSLAELENLMVRGTYEAPAGAYIPSVWY